MSLKRVVEALISLGLSRTEAQIYVFLEKNGSHGVIEIAQALNLHTKGLAKSLENLQKKQIVQVSAMQTIMFSAMPFEKTIELLIETKKGQAKNLQERKFELLSQWQNMIKKKSENN